MHFEPHFLYRKNENGRHQKKSDAIPTIKVMRQCPEIIEPGDTSSDSEVETPVEVLEETPDQKIARLELELVKYKR